MSAQQKTTTILLYGLGAIGSFYAFILSRNEQVILDVVARSNYDAVKQNVRASAVISRNSVDAKASHQGLKIESQNHGNHTVHPRNVFRQASEATDTYDYVVCAHKALKLDQIVPNAIRPAVGQDTTIVIIQNGVGNEDPFRTAFRQNTIISCVVSTL